MERNRIFAAWLINKYGMATLAEGSGVLDIAGGKGDLSAELVNQSKGSIHSTLVEPRPMRENTPGITHHSTEFNAEFMATHAELMKSCSLLVGMHPDEPTEDIVDGATKAGRPFAVVPCCVFPRLFPHRTIKTGEGVKKYSSFVRYLLEKNQDFRCESLPFKGRNKVVYWLGAAGKRGNT